ncbi:cyclic AMP-dependent transcription factor ATF-6 alpha [Clupea harengus]|uniref:Cyclic AMP-dependent transcription factor ATF-6 alpha n=1 Tax=Clupea harengus TaxID=7950 RepID=A0A6P3W6F7_CLUHA|nr:cyclic AMP-dependent transcription factor ATF-6 alpha [Clupea harengus]
MASALTLDFEDHLDHQHTAMNNVSDTGNIYIDQDGEWDISLFDELEGLGDADELFKALEGVPYAGEVPELDFDMDLPPWSPDTSGDASSTCTDGDVEAASLSPAHTLSSLHSPLSVQAHSPYSLPDEALSPQPQASPLSVCSDSSGFSELPPERPPPKRTNQTPRAKPVKRPIQQSPKVSIQPRPVITAAAPLQAKTIILQALQPIQPLQPVLPMVKPARVTIQPAPPAGRPVILPQPAQVFQIQTAQTIPTRVVTLSTLVPEPRIPSAAPPVVNMTLQSPASVQSSYYGSDEESGASRRQMRMIKNRESASQSRKKKKEYLLTLESRLKLALSENALLKNENGTLKEQLNGLMSENTVLKTTAPKRRAVCLMVLVVFLVFNIGPMSKYIDSDGSKVSISGAHTGRHLLGFTQDTNTPEESPVSSRVEESVSDEKALMVVKKTPLVFGAPPPCQPAVNRTKCIKLAHELRGWVHRHEVERTKTRRQSNTQTKSRTILKENGNKDEVTQILPVQYTESAERISGNELQVYYAPHRTYNDFFDEINRRGDTFYVVSFRRDHLLLPATNHNKGSRPKMSVVLPAMNINDSVINDKEFEVMMQIDCEVMNTRILHIKTSSIPPFLKANQTHSDTFYHPNPAGGQPTPTVGVLVGSA